MKKKLLLLSFLFSGICLMAQNIPYYSTTTMEAYEELENPISVNNGEIWNDGSSYPVYLDFDLPLFDQTYSSFNVAAGGGIEFVGFGSKSVIVYHTPFGGYLLSDRGVDESLSSIDYEVIGEEGEYILKVQWKNAGFVQWYENSDPTDFVDFQIWFFQEDAHVELRFGDNQTDPGTYGYPDAGSDPNPGPSIKFHYDDCDNILSYYFAADNPSYDYFDMCVPNYSFIDGTPSEGITYIITPNDNFVGIEDFNSESFNIYPNPVVHHLHVENMNGAGQINKISILDNYCRIVFEKNDDGIRNNEMIDVNNLASGVYILKIDYQNHVELKRFIKGVH